MGRHLSPWLGLLVLASCYQRPDALEQPLSGAAVFALGERMLYLRESPAEAVLLDLSDVEPRRRSWPFDCDVGPSRVLADGRLALVCWGDTSELRLLYVAGDGEPAWRTYPLASAYTSLVASDDGRYLVGFFGPGASSGHLFQNASEVCVIDLDAEPSEANPSVRVLDLRDRDPLAVSIGPGFEHGGLAGRLAVVSAPSLLAVFDVVNRGDAADLVPLVPSGSLGQVIPSRVRFFADRPDGRLEVLVGAHGSSDIFEVLFAADPEGVGGPLPDFTSTIRLLTLASEPDDFYPFVDEGGAVRVVALGSATQDLVLFDPDQGLQRVNRMPWRFTTLTPVTRGDGRAHFLLSAPGDGQAGRLLADFDVAEADVKSADTFTLIELGEHVSQLLPVAGTSTFVLRHGSGSLTLLDAVSHARSLVKELGVVRDARLVGTRFHVLTDIAGGSAYGVLDVVRHEAVTIDVPTDTERFLGVGDEVTLFGLDGDAAGALLGVRRGPGEPSVLEWRGFLLDGQL